MALEIPTPRLLLRLPEPSEADAVLDYFVRNREHLEPWSPVAPDGMYTLHWWEQRLRMNLDEAEAGTSVRTFMYLRGGTNEVLGSCNLSNIMRGPFQACFLGYSIDAAVQGQGLMTEAVRALVQYGFSALNLHRIMANYIPDNTGSGRVLEKAGFHREGLAPEYLQIAGRWQDHVLTAITNRSWRPEAG